MKRKFNGDTKMKKIITLTIFVALTLTSCSDMMEDFYKNSGADYRTDIYIHSGPILNKSTDGGKTFTMLISPVTQFAVVKDEVLYANGNILNSTKRAEIGFPASIYSINSITSDIYENFYIQVSGAATQDFYKYNGSLKQINVVQIASPFTKMWAVKFKGKDFFYGADSTNLHISTDGGQNFNVTTSPPLVNVADLIVYEDDAIFCVSEIYIYKSSDAIHFNNVADLVSPLVALAVDSKGRIYAVRNTEIVYTDNGINWSTFQIPVLANITDIAVDHNDDIFILNNFAGSEGLYLSTNRGQSFSQLSSVTGTKLEIVEYQDR